MVCCVLTHSFLDGLKQLDSCRHLIDNVRVSAYLYRAVQLRVDTHTLVA